VSKVITERRVIAALTAALLGSAAFATQAQAAACENLAYLNLPHTVITAAQSIPAGSYTPPGSTTTLTGLPAFCRVTATISPVPDSSIGIEVWLPNNWNGKYQQSGSHGFGGIFYWSEMAPQIIRGYATAITDMGHTAAGGNGFDVSWGIGHPQKIIDFGWRAVHELAEKAKLIIATYYGQQPRYAYFNGCSDGGREGLKSAQMFPRDFDGIIAGSGFPDYTGNETEAFVNDINSQNGGLVGAARTSALTLVGNAVTKACDALDGVTDGIIRDPRSCHFDPRTLVCAAGQSTNCLTQGEADAINENYRTVRDPVTGKYVMSGDTRGSEFNQIVFDWTGRFSIFQLNAYALAFQNVNPPTLTTFDLHKDLPVLEKVEGSNDALDTELTAFRQNGGKLIEWHGWGDGATVPGFIVKYYGEVVDQTGHGRVENVQDFYRLFMMPGVGHCGTGPGPDDIGGENQTPVSHDPEHDVVSALEAWRENGFAPQKLIASKLNVANNPAAGIVMQRPLCPYPSEAIYKGSGSTNDASNFYCGPSHEDTDDDDDHRH
jgi:feruloyl esterase